MTRAFPKFRTGAAATGLLLLAGCGGGGGNVASTGTPPSSGSTTTPTTPTPTPPVTTPPAVNYDDAEYQRSNAAVAARAITAYNAGATGAGVTLAVLDSGLAQVGTEFSGRVSAASRDFGGNGSFSDIDGHGTAVTAVAAAARNGSDVQGLAFGATILALRTDSAGSCASSGGCAFSSQTLTSALDYARTSGARIVNMSLGNSSAAFPPSLTAAIDRATAAGMIIVLSAGNDATADPDASAQVAASAAAHGLVVIAGSHDADGSLSSFSAKAGGYGRYYLAALGSRVRSFDQTGTDYLYSGTSFSTPAIAAAAALLEQAFPNLSPAQVVQLLYSTATDAGTAGVDSTYGNGLLNLTRAFQPLGTTSLAGSAIAITGTEGTVLSSAMGDAALHGKALGRAVVLDSIGRAFGVDLSASVARRGPAVPLAGAIAGNLATTASHFNGLDVSATVARGIAGEPWSGLAGRGRGYRRETDRPLAGAAVSRLGPRDSFGFAFAEGGKTLADLLAPEETAGSFLAARGPRDTPGFQGRQATSVAFRHRFDAATISVAGERGTLDPVSPTDPAQPRYLLASLRAERWLGRVRLGIGGATLAEDGSLLGARLAPALGRGQATTRYLDLDARLALGGSWFASAAWRRGWTTAAQGGLLRSGRLATSAAALDLAHAGAANRFALRVSLPPRVTAGGLRLAVPTSYDYATGAIGYATTTLSLAPIGRERDVEADYGIRLGAGWLESNLYWRRQPGNIAAAPDDFGAALRWSLGF